MKLILCFSLFILIISQAFAQLTEPDLDLLNSAYTGKTNEVVKALLNKANIDATTEEGVTALIYAAQRGYLDIVKILVFNGADIHHSTKNGTNALLAASMFDHPEIVSYLLQCGANINAVDNNRISSLHFASAYGYDSLAALLIRKGANLEAVDSEGNTPLIVACYTGNNEIAKMLVQSGANINYTDIAGYSPLLVSIQQKHVDLSSYLLENKADPNQISNSGASAIYLAVLSSDKEMISLLSKFNALQKPAEISPDPFILAFLNEDYSIIRQLRHTGFKNTNKFLVSGYIFSLNCIFNKDHIMLGLKTGIKENVSRLTVFADFQQRLFRRRILMETSLGTNYQYWESRSFAGAGLSREFHLSSNPDEKSLIFTRTAIYYTFGNLRGTYRNAETSWIVAAGTGIRIPLNNFTTFDCYIDYYFFCPSDLFPLHFTFGLSSFYPSGKLSNIYQTDKFKKKINWLSSN